MKYKTLVCGGTFDFLHKGHKTFLRDIFTESEKVVIGLTSNSYAYKFKLTTVQDFNTRKEALVKFLSEEKLLNRAEIIPIDDIYGPLLDKEFTPDAIAVTEETEKGAIYINKKRKELSLKKLKVLIFKMDKAEDGNIISSTKIRDGEIDENGNLLIKPEWLHKTFFLPQNLREELHKPFGKIVDSITKNINSKKVITIGDVTTQKFNDQKIGQFISIIDFVVERRRVFGKISDLGFEKEIAIIPVDNPAGKITSDLFLAIINSFKNDNRKIILVNGEEDLAVLPVLLAAPLGCFIYYGQPGEGLIEVEVNQGTKERGYQLLSKFEY